MNWKLLGLTALILTALLSVSRASPMEAQEGAGETLEQSIDVNGVERTYRVHRPAGVESLTNLPVLIVLHGGGGNGRQFERTSGISALSDQEGFIAVYPDGASRNGRFHTWNAYECCAYAFESNSDDVGFISALIDQVVADYSADPSRIYVTGFSNGEMMTFRLACELSDKIAAAAPVAGSLNSDACHPASPVPILIVNGEMDENVPVAGGASPGVGVKSQDDRVDRPTAFAVDTWVAANACAGGPVVTDTTAATERVWNSCANGSIVEQLLIHGWPHRWPSVENEAPLDGEQTIWDFVSQFSNPQSA